MSEPMHIIACVRSDLPREQVQHQRLALYNHGAQKGWPLPPDSWVEWTPDMGPAALAAPLSPHTLVLVASLVYLGRSIQEITAGLRAILEAGGQCHALEEDVLLGSGVALIGGQPATPERALAQVGTTASALVSKRVRERWAMAKNTDGPKPGRPKGAQSSGLDIHRETITAMLRQGHNKADIARRLGVPDATLRYYVKSRALEDAPEET